MKCVGFEIIKLLFFHRGGRPRYGKSSPGERGSVFTRLGGTSSGSVFSRLSGMGGERRGASWHKITVSTCYRGSFVLSQQSQIKCVHVYNNCWTRVKHWPSSRLNSLEATKGATEAHLVFPLVLCRSQEEPNRMKSGY